MQHSIMKSKLKPVLFEKFAALEFLKSVILLEYICIIARRHTWRVRPYPWVCVRELSQPSAKQQDGAESVI